MQIICDTHVLLFWADQPQQLSVPARAAVERGLETGATALVHHLPLVSADAQLRNIPGLRSIW